MQGSLNISVHEYRHQFVKFIIQDSGIGMSEKEVSNLDNFLNNQSTDINIIRKNSSGFGIGLTISNFLALKSIEFAKIHWRRYIVQI